jgi:glutamine synthetase
MGIRTLPGSLAEALDAMEGEPVVKSWLSPTMYESYVAVKRKEIEMFKDLSQDFMCERYRNAY